MRELLYLTGNAMKFRQASLVCEPFDISLQRTTADIPEIQAETGEPIAQDKSAKAFALLQKPLVVSDDSWIIPGLRGFPGPYMKYMNDWFTLADWVHLTKDLTDRTIILRQIVVYQDSSTQQLFSVDITGELLSEPRGTSHHPHNALVSFDGGHRSNAEYHERGESAAAAYHNPWHEFAAWYKEKEL